MKGLFSIPLELLIGESPFDKTKMKVYRAEDPMAKKNIEFLKKQGLFDPKKRRPNVGRWYTDSLKEAINRAGKQSAVYEADIKKGKFLRGAYEASQAHNNPKNISMLQLQEYKKDMQGKPVNSRLWSKIGREALLDIPENRRLSLKATAKGNPSFKGVRKEALEAAAKLGLRGASRVIPLLAFIDMLINPTPAYNIEDGYKVRSNDPRVRRKKTLEGLFLDDK